MACAGIQEQCGNWRDTGTRMPYCDRTSLWCGIFFPSFFSAYKLHIHSKSSKESSIDYIHYFFFFSRTLALIKPDAMPKLGELIDIIINAGFTITKAKMMMLSR